MTPHIVKQHSTGNIFADRYRIISGEGLGREYCIKGLHTFLNSNDCPKWLEVPDSIKPDLDAYQRYREEAKKKFRRSSRKSKLAKKARIINPENR